MSYPNCVLTTLRSGTEATDVDPVFLDQLPERAAVLLRNLRGASDVAAAGAEHALNVVLLKPCDLLRLRFSQRLTPSRQRAIRQHDISSLDLRLIAHHYRAFDSVFELAYVAGPTVDHQHVHRFVRKIMDLTVELT